jgi:hypothetical protein
MRKRVNKHLPDDIREFAMWSMALLVNTSTWEEIKENWRLICQVFLNYTTTDNFFFKQHYATVLHRISQITSDPNSSRAIEQSKQTISTATDPFEFDDDNKMDDYDNDQLHSNKNMKKSKKRKRSTISHVCPINIYKLVNNNIVLSYILQRDRVDRRLERI